ncbi:MAG: cytochrome c-type biogenesis protein CcmH [Limnochordales bacterium]
MGRWAAPVLFGIALAVWGWATVRDTVSQGLVMGERAPDAVLLDLAGNPVPLSRWAGKPLIVRFSSRTCSYCYDDFGYLEELQRELGEAVQVIAVEVGAPPDLVREAVRGRNQSYPVLVDWSGAAAEAYQLQGLPQVYFINAAGQLISRLLGELSEQDFRAHLAQILRPDGQAFASLEAEVRAIAQQVRCQECQGLSVWQSQAVSAWEMRDEIRQLLLAGMTRQEVLDELVDRYGVWILMSPPASGRFLWAYVIPFVALAAGGLWIYWRLGRRARAPVTAAETPVPEELDPETEARIRRRLQEYL